MRRITQPWKLCRIFGAQPVGTVGAPRCPKAGIAAQIISAQSSRWAFLKGLSPTADLPTCVLDSTRSSDASITFNSKVGDFVASLSSGPRMPSHGPSIVRTSSPMLPGGAIFLKIPLLIGNSEEPQFLGQGFRTEILSCSV